MARLNSRPNVANAVLNGDHEDSGKQLATPHKSKPIVIDKSRLADSVGSLLVADDDSPQNRPPSAQAKHSKDEENAGEERHDINDIDLAMNEEGAPAEHNEGDDVPPPHAAQSSTLEIQIPATRSMKRKQMSLETGEMNSQELRPTKKLRGPRKVIAKQPIRTRRRLRGHIATVQDVEPSSSSQAPAANFENPKGKKPQSKPPTDATALSNKGSRLKKLAKGKEIQHAEAERSPPATKDVSPVPENEEEDESGLYNSRSPSPPKTSPLRTKVSKLEQSTTRTRSQKKPKTQQDTLLRPELSNHEESSQHRAPVKGRAGRQATREVSKELEENHRAEQESAGDNPEESREEGEKEDEGDEENAQEPVLNSNTVIDVAYLEDMLKIAERAGHRKQTYMLKGKDQNLKTNNGRRLEKALGKLCEAIEISRAARISRNPKQIADADVYVVERIEGLETQVQSTLETRLRKVNSSNEYGLDSKPRTKHILRDIYFYIIPTYLEMMILAVRSDPLRKSTRTDSLERFDSLTKHFLALVSRACEIPTEYQPRIDDLEESYGTKTFTIRQPARVLRSKIRYVLELLNLELESRQTLEDIARDEERRLMQDQKQLEIEKMREAEHVRRVKERRKEIQEAYAKIQASDDALWGTMTRRERIAMRKNGGMASRPHNSQAPSSVTSFENQERHNEDEQDEDGGEGESENEGEDEEANPFAFLDESNVDFYDEVERVPVFPRDNRRDTVTRGWTTAETNKFIELIRAHNGDDRYSKIAEITERSLEEVFAYAKLIQEAFDAQHEEGNLVGPGEAWTYNVY